MRFVQGIAEAFITTASFALVTIEFPRNTSTYVGYLEMALGLGLTLGPVLGSGFMAILGSVFYTFIAFAVLLVLGLISIIIGLPSSLNNPRVDLENKEENNISFKMFIRHYQAFMCILAVLFALVCMLFYEPALTI